MSVRGCVGCPGLCVAEALGRRARVAGMLHAGFELALVRDSAETLGFGGREMELWAWLAVVGTATESIHRCFGAGYCEERD